jgi:hypothetical protein
LKNLENAGVTYPAQEKKYPAGDIPRKNNVCIVREITK